jgi:hypothetical protein
VTFLGGMQTIPEGESVFLTIDLEPGVEYTALDFTTSSRETHGVLAGRLHWKIVTVAVPMNSSVALSNDSRGVASTM